MANELRELVGRFKVAQGEGTAVAATAKGAAAAR